MPNDVLTFATALKDIALSTALILVLYGGYKRWWVFGQQLIEAQAREEACKADYTARLAAAERREDEWKKQALDGGYIARQAVDSFARRSGKDRG